MNYLHSKIVILIAKNQRIGLDLYPNLHSKIVILIVQPLRTFYLLYLDYQFLSISFFRLFYS